MNCHIGIYLIETVVPKKHSQQSFSVYLTCMNFIYVYIKLILIAFIKYIPQYKG